MLSSAFGRVVAGGVARQAAVVETMLGRAVGPEDFDEWTWFLVERGRRLSSSSTWRRANGSTTSRVRRPDGGAAGSTCW